MKFKGEIEGFPPEVVEMMLYYQKKHTGYVNVNNFERNVRRNANNRQSGNAGFSWGDTGDGFEFWDCVIGKRDFERFFVRYPKGKSINSLHYEQT